ncbi:MAG: hypothetical protein ACI81L_003619 [Verrucomicrobiales bacterium]|jgi:hypothetical protein
MEGLIMTETSTAQLVERHPVRGAIWGLILGLGLAIYLIIFKVITIGAVIPIVVIVLSIGAGIAWGKFAPPRSKR